MFLETINTGFSSVAIFIGVTILFFLLLAYFSQTHHGPRGLPYFGIYPFLRPNYLTLTEMARKKYGDVFLFQVTGQWFIHLGNFDAVREAHLGKPFNFPTRMNDYAAFRIAFEKGLVLESGEERKIHDAFYMQVLRELAINETRAGPIQSSIRHTLARLHSSKGESFGFSTLIAEPFTEVTQGVCFGESNMHLVPDIVNAYLRLIEPLGAVNILLTGSFARYFILPWYQGYRNKFKAWKDMESKLYEAVHIREPAAAAGWLEDTIIDHYLQERNIRKANGDPQAKLISVEAFVGLLIQIYGDLALGAGSFVASMLTELATKAEVQQRIRDEMNRVLGEDVERLPTWEHRNDLPYTNAVMKELLRCSSFFPIFPGFECAKETTVGGVHVPVGALTMVNGWAINHDPKVFENPDEFRPERYLSDGGESETAQRPFAFNIVRGMATCIGESFNLMMLYYFITAIVRQFVLKPAGSIPNSRWFDSFLGIAVSAIPVEEHKLQET